jgi:hypothetical protein
MNTWHCRIILVAIFFALALPSASGARDNCTDASLKGDYGFTIAGQGLNATGTESAVNGVALTHFDGAGKLTQADFVVTDGKPGPGDGNSTTGFHFQTGETGTYTVNPDCTGQAEIHLNVPVPQGSTGVIKLIFVLTNRGRTIHTVVAEFIPPGATAPVFNTTHSDGWRVGSVSEPE